MKQHYRLSISLGSAPLCAVIFETDMLIDPHEQAIGRIRKAFPDCSLKLTKEFPVSEQRDEMLARIIERESDE